MEMHHVTPPECSLGACRDMVMLRGALCLLQATGWEEIRGRVEYLRVLVGKNFSQVRPSVGQDASQSAQQHMPQSNSRQLFVWA